MAAADTQYLDATAGLALANTLPGLAAFKASVSGVQAAALLLATLRIDSRQYQGRKYDTWTPQLLEFPRAIGAAAVSADSYGRVGADDVWDWDASESEAVVPDRVELACLFEADSIIDGTRDEKQRKLLDGLASQSVDGLSESYREVAKGAAAATQLCAEAERLLKKYVLTSGELL